MAFAPEIGAPVCRRRDIRFERFNTTCTRGYFAGPACRGTYPRTVAASMLETRLDECRSWMSLLDSSAGQDASDHNCRAWRN